MMSVTNRVVAVNTIQHVASRVSWQHVMHEVAMAMYAGLLGHSSISRLDLYWLVILPTSEGPGM